jgi:D-alanyl-D-alanine dipeptidase
VIDQIATNTRLMADNAQDAILFGNTKPKDLWLATYQKYANNLYSEANNLTHSVHSVGNAVEFAGVSKEYQELRHDLGVRTSP